MTKSAHPPALPVVLELAPLPREQVGPFILLGLSKTPDKEKIEANWAQRVIWARKNQLKVPLEDINWAREMVTDPEKRVKADAASLNLDTSDGVLQQIIDKYQGQGKSACQPLDVEKDLSTYTPPIDIPDPETIRGEISIPEIPREFPAVQHILEHEVKEPLDPWKLDLP